MTNHIEAARRLARAVAAGGATELTIAIFRVYLAAAGASVKGAWVYIPGRATPLKGWRAAAEYVAHLADTAAFLRNFANAIDYADREVNGPPVEMTPLGRQIISAADMTPLAARADDLNAVAKHVAELASDLAALGATPPPPVDPETLVVPAAASLAELVPASHDLTDRIVRRAVYTAGKTMLSVLDGWIEGARENHEAMGRREPFDDSFAPDDVRRMVNDMCNELGAPEAYRPAPS